MRRGKATPFEKTKFVEANPRVTYTVVEAEKFCHWLHYVQYYLCLCKACKLNNCSMIALIKGVYVPGSARRGSYSLSQILSLTTHNEYWENVYSIQYLKAVTLWHLRSKEFLGIHIWLLPCGQGIILWCPVVRYCSVYFIKAQCKIDYGNELILTWL